MGRPKRKPEPEETVTAVCLVRDGGGHRLVVLVIALESARMALLEAEGPL